MLPTEYLPFLITSHSTEFASYCPIEGTSHTQNFFTNNSYFCFAGKFVSTTLTEIAMFLVEIILASRT